ncbi:MAG: hypothetical protein ACRCWF_01950 [Beijerinckiaceae bacterium]
MPASAGLKVRPHFGLSRPISSHRLRLGNLAGLLPRAVFVPLVALSLLTATTAVLLTSTLDNAEHQVGIEQPETTATIGKTN